MMKKTWRATRNVRENTDKEIKRNLYSEHGHILMPSAITLTSVALWITFR